MYQRGSGKQHNEAEQDHEQEESESQFEAPVRSNSEQEAHAEKIRARRAGAAGPTHGAAEKTMGQPLPGDLRTRFERSLGANLGEVRIHTGAESDEAARDVGARAYTVGQDIHFAAGQYAPGTEDGDRLIAHEVAHTVQQGGAAPATPQAKLEVSTPGDSAEVEADSAASAMVSGDKAGVSQGGPSVARKIMREAKPGASPAPANFQANEKVDTKKIATLINGVNAVSDEIGMASTDASVQCQTMLGRLSGGDVKSALGAYEKLGNTFDRAFIDFEAELKAHDASLAANQEMLLGLVGKAIGAAIGQALGPAKKAIAHTEDLEKAASKVISYLSSIGGALGVALLTPKAKTGPTIEATGTLMKAEGFQQIIGMATKVGSLTGQSSALSGACLKVVPKLIQNLDALLLGKSTTTGTIKSPSECEAEYQKLQQATAQCTAIKVGLKNLQREVDALVSSAVMQAETDRMSAERQLWTAYHAANPSAPWLQPACFGNDKRPGIAQDQMRMVGMIGKTGVCTAPINASTAGSDLLPNVPVQSAGQVTIGNQKYPARAPNGKRIPAGTECRILDARVGADLHGAVAQGDAELIVDADIPAPEPKAPPVPAENKSSNPANASTPAASTTPAPGASTLGGQLGSPAGKNFQPNETVDVKKTATLIDGVTQVSERIGDCASSATIKTDAMLARLTDSNPTKGALGAYNKLAKTFEAACSGFEAKVKEHDKDKADAHATSEKIFEFVLGEVVGLALGPVGASVKAIVRIEQLAEFITGGLEDVATQYAMKLLKAPPPLPSKVDPSARLQHLEQLKKILSLVVTLGGVSARVSNLSGAALTVVPKVVHNLSALMMGGSVEGGVKPPSECEAAAKKLMGLGKDCDAIDATLKTLQAHVDELVSTATKQAEVMDKASAERKLWTKFQDDNPEARVDLEFDVESAFGKQPRDGMNAEQRLMTKTIGKRATVIEPINGSAAKPLVPGGIPIAVNSPGRVQVENRKYKASTAMGAPHVPAGTQVKIIDSRSGTSSTGAIEEQDWQLIVDATIAEP